ncbi:MAG: YCF48-related protein [Actinomycetota bacterium]
MPVTIASAILLFLLSFAALLSADPGGGRALADPGSGWTNQSENYFGLSRNAVCAVSESTAWVAGASGSILKTVDGGATWDLQGTGTANNLCGIAAADSDNVWAVSSSGDFLKTSNGGVDWVVQKTGAGVPEAVSAVDGMTAWVAGSEYGTLMNRMIWKTTDGGNTWVRKDTPSGMGLTSISAVDANTAWAVTPQRELFSSAGALFKTADGGDSWVMQATDLPGLREVCAVDLNVAWAIGDSGAVIKTEDGGETWELVRTGTESLLSVSAWNDQVAWAVGYGGTILGTTDGGMTWSQQGSVAVDLNSVYAASAATAWAVGANGTILKTSNGGASWLEMIDTSMGMTRDLNCVSAISPQVAWAGGEGILLRTIDGGITWDTIYESSTTHILDICAIDANDLWVVGREGDATSGTGFIYRTTDGGSSWTPQYFLSGGQINGISALDSSAAWAVGSKGTIVKTVNGGASWTVQASPTQLTLTSVSAVDINTAWAAALSQSYSNFYNTPPPFENAPYYPIILKTSDGGANWSASQLGTYNEGFNGIDAADADHVIAVGRDISYSPLPGLAVKDPFTFPPQYYLCLVVLAQYGGLVTHDGGGYWAPQASNLAVTLNDVCAVDTGTAWVVGGAGTIFKTGDGAATWVSQQSSTGLNLNDISAVDSSTAWAVGTGGTILKTSNGGDARPDIVALVPATGDIGSVVTITGCDFGAAIDSSGVFFGAVRATAYLSWSNSEIVVKVPPGANGNIKVRVATASGNSNEVAFTGPYVNPAPTVTSVAPNTGSQFAWALDLQIAGSGFQPGAGVRLEKGAAVLNAYNVNVISENQITCTVGAFGAEPGAYDVVVVNPDGQEARLPGAFTVTSPCGAGSGAALLMLGLTLGLLSLAGTAGWSRKAARTRR